MDMKKLVIFLSVLSIPNPTEVGLMSLTIYYFSFTFIAAFLSIILRIRSANNLKIKLDANVFYVLLIFLLIIINFLISNLYSVPYDMWIKRSIHLSMIPVFYLIFTYRKPNMESLFKCVYYMGLFEVVLIFFTFGLYLDTDEIRRATDIEGVILYSVWIVFSAYYSLEQYRLTKQRKYLFVFSIIILAEVLTGSRILLVSTVILLFGFIKDARIFIYIMLTVLLFMPLNQYGFFDRFDLDTEENMITVYSKVEEIEYLIEYFLTNPVFGVGFGRPYQITMANSEYTYSHNIFLFYLAYGGIIGFFIALYPLIKLSRTPGYGLLAISFSVFYLSSTSYTNIKHSILMALILILVKERRGIIPIADRASAGGRFLASAQPRASFT